jgi:protein-S-isoprenylcysteine O-methyltransferase Ste14
LLTGGLYRYARHPIYSGVILVFVGLSLIYLSVYKLMITSFLIMLFIIKTTYEEKQLEKKFIEYREYKSRTGRFFPDFRKKTID